MKSLLLTIVCLSILGFARPAQAYLELNTFYSSEGLATASTAGATRMMIEGSVGFGIDKSHKYNVGWAYATHSASDTGSIETTYTSTQMGPRFIYVIDKDKRWSLGLGYYLVTTGTFKTAGGSEEKWKGTALKVDLGYNFPVSEDFFVGLRLNYSSASYSERLVGDTDYTKVSYTRTAMYPSIYLFYLF
jgi:hypothetical protein